MTPKFKPLEWHPTTISGEHLRDTARDMDGRMRYEVGVTPGNFRPYVANAPKGHTPTKSCLEVVTDA